MGVRPVQSHRAGHVEGPACVAFNNLLSLSLKFLIIFELVTSEFHFALGPTNYVACSILPLGKYLTALSESVSSTGGIVLRLI